MELRLRIRLLAAGMLCVLLAGFFPSTASANIYQVTNTNNSGAGSLRQAIIDANNHSGLDSINFNISGCSGICTIQLASGLPAISSPVFIDGLTQSGAGAGDLWGGSGHTLLIEIDGSLLSASQNGFNLFADGCTIRGLVINQFPSNGILVMGSDNTIETNYIGTDRYGVANLGNGGSGVRIVGGDYNTIGGNGAGAGNLISGNDLHGVSIERNSSDDAAGNIVQGNFIGTDVDGVQGIRNAETGVIVSDATWNTIGGDGPNEGNLISGNSGYGVLISGKDTYNNTVQGNYIGTTRSGTVSVYELGNGLDGVVIADGNNSTIGGDQSNDANLISGNGGDGIRVTGADAASNDLYGNLIGTDVNGSASIPNGGHGVRIQSGAKYTHVGGDVAGQGNLISGNDESGVSIFNAGSDFNVVSGNLIGTDAAGTSAIANGGHGVYISSGAQQNTIGGDTVVERNIISGNTWSGVRITGLATDYNYIRGNYIGTVIDGTTGLPNGNDGVVIDSGASSNTVGGSYAGEGNLISGNTWSGVSIYGNYSDSNYVVGNSIGTDATGGSDLGNGYVGVYIGSGAEANTVGGATANHRNVISGNDLDGVKLQGPDVANNVVQGNYIGLASDGETPLGNALDGVIIYDSALNNTVGGDEAGEGNIIAANGSCGVAIWGAGTISNTVIGNYLGTDKDGEVAHANGLHGVFIGFTATGNTVGGTTAQERNVISGNGGDGVRIENPGTINNLVQGNYIGTDVSGLSTLHNSGSGVGLRDGAQNNTIGGNSPAFRNLISGNYGSGVTMRGSETSNNMVRGNYIGIGADGNTRLGNASYGVFIFDGANTNTIGGPTSASANVIGANPQGVHIEGEGTDFNVVVRNYIGTDHTGTLDLGQFPQGGVMIVNGASDNTIGPDNVIAFNATDGVRIYGAASTGNEVTQSRIFENGSEGIFLGSGANGGILAPTITSTSLASMSISGTACGSCTVEVFANPDTDGEGKIFLGSTTTSAGGSFTLTVGGIPAPYLTATAMDSTDGTSEFSAVFTSSFGSLYLPVIMR